MLHKKQAGRPQTSPISFIGRTDAKQLFFGLLSQQQPVALPLIMYHGADGNGKTSLVRELQQFCALPEESVPYILLDFEAAAAEGGKITSVHAAVIRLAEQAKKSRTRGIQPKRMERILADAKKLSHYRASVDSQDGLVLVSGGAQLIDAAMKGVVEGIVISGVGFMVSNHKVIVNTFKNIFSDFRDSRADVKLQALSPEEVQDTLDKDYAARFVASFDSRPGRSVRAVLFFDAYELAASDKKAGWLKGLHLALREQGVLLVVAGHQELTGWHDGVENVPIHGFTAEEAANYLDAAGAIQRERFGLVDQMPPSLKQEILAECLHHSERDQDYYSPALLEGYADVLRIELEKGASRERASYPGSLHLDTPGPGKDHVGRLLEKTFRVLPETHAGIKPWLCELALALSFDEQFADAVNFRRNSRHSNAPSIDWAFLSELSILNRQEVMQGRKKRVFYSLPRAYKQELVKEVTPEHSQDTHRVGVEHWLERAEAELSNSEYDLYTMEQPYWQKLMSNCLSHLHALREPVTPKTLLLITKLLLDFYWWWCENLPHEAWHAMVDRAVALTREEHGEVGEVLALLKRFDAAWPKWWQLNPQNWKPEEERTEEEKGWDYSEVLSSLEALRKILDARTSGLRGKAGVEELRRYTDSMLSYYEGHAHHYRALTAPDSEPASTFRQAEEALVKYGDFDGFKPERHAALKRAWSRIALAELCLDVEDYPSATAHALEALRLLPRPEDQEGVDMEGTGNAYHALSRIAGRHKDWGLAGKRMGIALIFNFGFYATDQDDYSHESYHYQQRSARDFLRATHEHSPDGALRYLTGFKGMWGDGGAVPGSSVSVEALLFSFDEVFPPKLAAKPSHIEKKDFKEAEARFRTLRESIQAELVLRA